MTKRTVCFIVLIGCILATGGLLYNWRGQSGACDPVGKRSDMSRALGIRRDLRENLYCLRWIAYSPTNYNPNASPPVLPSDDSVRADLKVLRNAGFSGLITYGAHLTSIPSLSREAGFRGMLLGVWDPKSRAELLLAMESAKQDVVIGIIIGNEGVSFKRYSLEELHHAMQIMRRETEKPISTTEIYERYFDTPKLVEWSDFLAVNAHPFFHGLREPQHAVEWTVAAYGNLEKLASKSKPIILKESGLPSEGEKGLSEQNQALYYGLLQNTKVTFAFFESFDQSWKKWGSVEPHWGLFRSNRTPKLVVGSLRLI